MTLNIQVPQPVPSTTLQEAPNLFRFAPSELSQDAFICWLLEWADRAHAHENQPLHRAGLHFLNSLLAKHGLGPLKAPHVVVRTQEDRIDVTCRINDDLFLLIEDKTNTADHSNQLKRYLELAKDKYPKRQVLPILLKTGDQASYEHVRQHGYRPYLRADLLAALDAGQNEGVTSDIFDSFHRHLQRLEAEVQSYQQTPLADWTDAAWRGFYMQLQNDLQGMQWQYVANPSGGFLAAYWHYRSWGDHIPYLQIEQGPLCFKIEADPAAQPRKVVDSWLTSLNQGGDTLGLPRIRNGRRFKRGTWMTVATWDDWRVATKDGLLDYEATLANLRSAEARLEAALT